MVMLVLCSEYSIRDYTSIDILYVKKASWLHYTEALARTLLRLRFPDFY